MDRRGTVATEDDFWDTIIQQLDLFQQTEEQSLKEKQTSTATTTTAEGNAFVAKATAGMTASDESTEATSNVKLQMVSSRITALAGLRESKRPIVIDDFHYLPKEMQATIVRALKPLIFDGLPTIIIAIPHRRYDALKVEKEMTGRILPVNIPVWTDDELRFIATTGFNLLNYGLPEELSSALEEQSIGSPHLMQDFCRAICKALSVQHMEFRTELTLDKKHLHSLFQELADTVGRPIFEKLARGPRQRTDRVSRQLKSGETVDIYGLILHALAHLRPGLVSLEYEDLRSALREVSASPVPQLHEVARVLKHMATIASSDQSSTPVIDFEESEKKLHVTDPFFAFYLRWGNIGNE
jgi:hypothetical protein